MAELSRYKVAASPQDEYQSGSRGRVLRNHLGITSKRKMDQAEFDALTVARIHFEQTLTSATRIDAKIVCDMHQKWLGRIYPWAGVYRTVELAKDGFH